MRARRLQRVLLAAMAMVVLAPTAAVADPPLVGYSLSGPAGNNGWYVGTVAVNWSISGADTATCPAVDQVSGDTGGTTRSCSATNVDGTTTTITKSIKIDKTPPTNLAATPARPPDAPPFYTAPVPITWSATDPTSGIASCTSTTYAGPDGSSVAPQGSCRDNAGNTTAPLGLTFAYDATAPALSAVTATAAANRTVALAWTAAPDAQTVTVTRQPGDATVLLGAPAATTSGVTDGPLAAATTYTYTVTARDAAGNATAATAAATTPAPLSAKAANEAGKAKTPTLRWKAMRNAKYYNVQLFRNGRKVLSAWPTVNRYTLHTKWRFRGRTHKLTSGRYRWYVWPGYGPRASHRYGRLVAKGVVRQP